MNRLSLVGRPFSFVGSECFLLASGVAPDGDRLAILLQGEQLLGLLMLALDLLEQGGVLARRGARGGRPAAIAVVLCCCCPIGADRTRAARFRSMRVPGRCLARRRRRAGRCASGADGQMPKPTGFAAWRR